MYDFTALKNNLYEMNPGAVAFHQQQQQKLFENAYQMQIVKTDILTIYISSAPTSRQQLISKLKNFTNLKKRKTMSKTLSQLKKESEKKQPTGLGALTVRDDKGKFDLMGTFDKCVEFGNQLDKSQKAI